jgi:phosphomannomutase
MFGKKLNFQLDATKLQYRNNMINYIFDIDGTLTQSRLPINPQFEVFYKNWIKGKNVYLVTGSDKEKTIEQIGEEIWSSVKRVYQSCGNQVWEKGILIRQKDFTLNIDIKNLLLQQLENSKWKEKFGNHLEERIGLVNFSIIGRNCPQNKREEYYEWDQKNHERIKICEMIMNKFPNVEASIGGQISIDIYQKGCNKAQVLEDILDPIYFFGDKMELGGNDYPIAHSLKQNNKNYKLFKVNNPDETWDFLKKI